MSETLRSNEVVLLDSRPAVYTVASFCATHHISRTHLHTLEKGGNGPRRMKVGSRVLISAEAAAEWRKAMESPRTR